MKRNNDTGQDQPAKATKPLIKSMKKVGPHLSLSSPLDGFALINKLMLLCFCRTPAS